MQTRRPLAILAATALAGLGLTTLATPASANEITVTIGGQWTGGFPWTGGSVTFSPTGNIGDSLNASSVLFVIDSPQFQLGNDGVFIESTALSLQQNGDPCQRQTENCTIGNAAELLLYVLPDASGEPVKVYSPPNGEYGALISSDGLFDISYSQETNSTTSDSGPDPVMQQFPIPETGTCNEAQPAGLNWGGASSGGWGESWARWVNEGQGGTVCTRTLAYNNSTATWQVQ